MNGEMLMELQRLAAGDTLPDNVSTRMILAAQVQLYKEITELRAELETRPVVNCAALHAPFVRREDLQEGALKRVEKILWYMVAAVIGGGIGALLNNLVK